MSPAKRYLILIIGLALLGWSVWWFITETPESAKAPPVAAAQNREAPTPDPSPAENTQTVDTPSGGIGLAVVDPEKAADVLPGSSAGSRFEGKIIDERITPTDTPGVYQRIRLMETDFHYPVLRLEETVRNPGTDEETVFSSTEMVGDHILVKLKDGTGEEQLRELIIAFNGSIARKHALPGLYRVTVPVKTVDDLPRALAILTKADEIAYAEPDYIVHADINEPDDPRYTDGTLWGLNNTGQEDGVADKDIDAPEGWDIRSDASGIVVAVIDTGILYTHEDLADNMWTNTVELNGTPGVDDDANGYIDDIYGINAITGTGDPIDDNRHGTHCAGTIGGAGNNATGVTGVAWDVQLMACKFLGAGGSGSSSDAVDCVLYAIQNGASVLSNSWGGGSYNQALEDAIRQAEMADVLFIAAAGNEGTNIDPEPRYPTSYPVPNIVAVASYTREGYRSSFSNYGPATVHVAAPGSDIYSSTYAGDPAVINAYEGLSGTSMATPHVSGIMALMRAQFPSESYQSLVNRLLDSADTSIMSGFVVSGGTNLEAALSGTATGPYNDPFDRARYLGKRSFTTLGTNLLATAETDEPAHAGVTASHSVWFKWVAPFDNTVEVYTEAPDSDTVIAVYQGSDLATLTPIASNDNDPDAATSGYDSYVEFSVTRNQTFLIAVDSADGSTGGFTLSVENTPANDDFADASPWSGTGGTFRPENYGATKEPGEPRHGDLYGGSSIWYSYTPAYDGRLRVGNGDGSPVDIGFGIYSGTEVSNLTELGGVRANKNQGANAYGYLEAGITYKIAADTPDGKESWFFINWAYTSNEARFNDLELTIAEDDPAGRIDIPVERYLGTGSGGATEVAWGTSAAPNGATNGIDYTTSSGTLSWGTNEDGFKTITIPILDNSLIQGDRVFYVTLGTPTNGAYVPPLKRRVKVTITDDDNPLGSLPGVETGYAFQFDNFPALTIDDAAWVAIRRLGETAAAGTVQLGTADGTAVAGVDYAATSVTVDFAAGQTLAFVPIDLLAPTGGTSFTVTLSAPTDPDSDILGGSATVDLTGAVGTFLDPVTVVSRDNAGGTPAGVSGTTRIDASADGRFIVFDSILDGLVPGDGNGQSDVFLRDEATGELSLISLSRFGGPGEGASTHPSISADGRFIAYASTANDIVATDANEHSDIFVFDRVTGTTVLASVNSNGDQAEKKYINLEDPVYTDSIEPEISGDGTSVIFISDATNLDTLHESNDWDDDVFVRDLGTGITEFVSVDSAWLDGNGYCGQAAVSHDGQTIAFVSACPYLAPEDANFSKRDVFIRERTNDTTSIASLLPGGGGHDSFGSFEAIALSGDGSTLAFSTYITGYAPGDTDSDLDVFVRDLATGDITVANINILGLRISLASGDADPLALSHDGEYLAFGSVQEGLIPYPTGESTSELLFVRHLPSGSLFIASRAADDSLPYGSIGPVAMTPDASSVLFSSSMEDLAGGGNPAADDIFGGPSGIHDTRNRFFFDAAASELVKGAGDSVIEIPVRRSGNLATQVSIDYETISGTALPGIDYNPISGTLDFLAGEVEKLVPITIHNPQGTEPARSFQLVLDDTPPDFLFPIGNSHEVTLIDQQGLLQSIHRISGNSAGTGGDQNSDFPSIDATGTLAVFSSKASNLAGGATVTTANLFLFDYSTNSLQLLALDPHVPGTETGATYPVISGNGEWVAFRSSVDGLTPEGGLSFVYQVYLANLQTGAITLVSKSALEEPGSGSTHPYSGNATFNDTKRFPFDLSDDGRFLAFHSSATNLIASDTNGNSDIFLYDRVADSLVRIDNSDTGGESSGESYNPTVSSDGRYVAFVSAKADLVPDDTNGLADVFRYDAMTGTTERVSVADDQSQANGPSYNCSISGDGQFVAFDSAAGNLIGTGDTNGYVDCFVRDIAAGTTERVSVTSDGSQTEPFYFGYWLSSDKWAGDSWGPVISADGEHIAFFSHAANIDPTVQFPEILTDIFSPNNKLYIHNRETGETTGLIPVQIPGAYADAPVLSADGRVAALWSQSADLIPDDNNARYDAFLAPNPTHPALVATGYALWQVLNFFHEARNPAVAGLDADPDNDFIRNIHEYMLGLNPNAAEANSGSFVRFGIDSLGTDLELSFPISEWISDVSWTLEASPSMQPGTWAPLGAGEIRTGFSEDSPFLDRVHLFVAPPDPDSARFYRLDFQPDSTF
ncbi:MAG: S8 family serine peptidase [Oceanipulchritudo sp.]